MAQVLNWDLRPVTIYDFVRAFCSLLPAARAAKCSSSSSSRDQDREDMGQLVVGAEEIADLSACGAFLCLRARLLSPRVRVLCI